MELTGKCLIDFWKWYLLPEQREAYKTNSLRGKESAVKIRFLAMSFTERFGVYVDFFDSVGIHISITSKYNYFGYIISRINIPSRRVSIKDRPTARDFSILESNAIYNN